MKIYNMTKGHWISGVSDGLTLPCGICKLIPKFDYIVDDDFWKRVAPKEHRLSVICLSCLDKLAVEKGEDVSKFLEFVQFTGIRKTIELKPESVYYYERVLKK